MQGRLQRVLFTLFLSASNLALAAPAARSHPQDGPLRVFLRAGPKTHGEGEHDHPRFLLEWKRLLGERGASVAGDLRFPTTSELLRSDVLVMYAAEAASIVQKERDALRVFQERGGGLVVLHDAVCGDDPQWFKAVAGGAWEHGHSKWAVGRMGLYFDESDHPITQGVANFDLTDEIYHDLHLAEEAQVLATSFHTPFDVTPQMWVLEKENSRAFVAIQGHYRDTFSHPAWRTLVLRGIAWAGKRDVDLLTNPDEVALLAYPPGGPTAPEEAHESFEVHQDFEISLAAAEPLVINPISIDWDARGRTWVALTPGYPYKQESSGVPASDEIAILKDADGDGRFDSKTVFYSGLDLVTSLVMHEDGVIVSASPQILWLRDTNGDDKADQVETLYEGFGYGDTHAVVSNLRWGLDGWIYGTQGYSGGDSRQVAGQGEFGHVPNGLLRFRPDGSAIEVIASYASNTWGLDFTPDGELFFSMANGSHLRHVVMPESALARARVGKAQSWKDVVDHRQVNRISEDDRPVYRQIDFVGGFTAAAGCLLYQGQAWPAEFIGNHFVCEPTVNLVHRDVLKPSNVSFKASRARQKEFLASRDLWFRPVHLRIGPDGAMWLLDFYNQAIVHNDTRGPQHGPTNAAIRPDRDRSHGRIWRIQHRQANELAVPRLDTADSGSLVRALSQDSPWVRETAHRLLRERSDTSSVAPLAAQLMARADEPPLQERVHAMWLIEHLSEEGGGVGASRLAAAIARGGTERRHALRLAALYGASAGGALLREPLLDTATAPYARDRLLALVALGHFSIDSAGMARLASLFDLLEDDWTRSALVGVLLGDPDAGLRAALAAKSDGLVAELAGQVARLGDPETLSDCLVALADGDAPASSVEAALLLLRRRLRPGATPAPSSVLDAALSVLLERPELEIGIATLPWVPDQVTGGEGGLAQRVQELGDRLSAIAVNAEEVPEERLQAWVALSQRPERRSETLVVAKELLAPLHSPETHLQVIEVLSRLESDQVAEVLADAFPSLAHTVREKVFDALLARPTWTQGLLSRLEDEHLKAGDLGPLRKHRLENHPDEAIAARARKLFGSESAADGGRSVDALVASLLPSVRQPGDVGRGAEIFAEQCGTCHSLRGEGGKVGPDLTGIGAHGVETLLPVVLDPSREVDPAYLDYLVKTVDGRMITGVVARETEDSIVLRSSSGEVEVLREDVEAMKSTGLSPMPVGFESLGGEKLRDLFAHLVSGYEGYRALDLSTVANANTAAGLYDPERDPNAYRFLRYGVLEVDGVPFDLPNPASASGGSNALVLGGGAAEGWTSKGYPLVAEIPVGHAVARMHVLGGVAAWGHPWGEERGAPAVRWTWVYADGEEESLTLHDGQEFADWIGRFDVPGSDFVSGLLAEGSPGQVRRFTLTPARSVVVSSIRLESFDNHLAPTFLALTVELPEAGGAPAAQPVTESLSPPYLLMGGGSSHDFERWFDREDRGWLAGELGAGEADIVAYTDRPRELLERIGELRVLALSCNQALPDDELRTAIFDHVEAGKGLFLLHAATWINWPDWPAFNAELVGGGARSHEDYGRFRVDVTQPDHPALQGVPPSFEIEDELYRFQPDPAASVHILAAGTSLATGERYPVIWTVEQDAGRILATTLGHDGGAHQHEAFRALLASGFRWLDSH